MAGMGCTWFLTFLSAQQGWGLHKGNGIENVGKDKTGNGKEENIRNYPGKKYQEFTAIRFE